MWKTQALVGSVCAGFAVALASWPAAVGAEKLGLEASASQVGKYEKVEFSIHLDTEYRNPFDPDEVDLAVLVSPPSGRTLVVPAFYGQKYQRRRLGAEGRGQDWFYPAGQPRWTARFAPMELGPHSAVAQLKDSRGVVRSGEARFECRPSDRKGFLRASRNDPRFLEFAEGQPFFAIGQNLAFIGHQQYADLSKAEAIFGKLAANGANFLRIWTCAEDWALAIEARKSAWGRSWDWRPPIVPMPDDAGGAAGGKCLQLSADRARLVVSPSHPVAVMPQTRYVFSGKIKAEGQAAVRLELGAAGAEVIAAPAGAGRWIEFRSEFTTSPGQLWLGQPAFRLEGSGTAWLADLSLRQAGGGPELLWEADVNRPTRGFYNPLDSFMLDELVAAAEKHGIYLQLCLITRDLYMSSLKDEASPQYAQAIADARKLLRYAVARWGYSTHVAAWEYFNEIDPALPTDRFYAALGEYLEQVDPYRHLRCTSTWSPSPKDCRHPRLDIAEVHFYLRPSDKSRGMDEVGAVLDRARFLREHAPARPALVGEFGLATEKWGLSDDMKADRELVHFHNALWASGLSGLSGTALFWWWDQLDRMDAYAHYQPLAAFLADVPFASPGLKNAAATTSSPQVRAVGLQGEDWADLWLFNSQAAWSSYGLRGAKPAEIQGAKVEIAGLAPATYRVAWWDTYQGRVMREESGPLPGGSLQLLVPAFTGDIACKIRAAR